MGLPQKILRRSTTYALAAPGANTDILATALEPAWSAAYWRISVALAVSSTFNATVTDGSTAYTWGLNASAALNAGDLYIFDMPAIGPGYSVNFQVETDGVIQVLTLDEIEGII